MTFRVAINGYGRIGRNILRAFYESRSARQWPFEIVAINDLAGVATNAHLTRYDSVHGRFAHTVTHDTDALIIDGDRIAVTAIRDVSALPWADLGVDIVLECTGLFASREKAAQHLAAGAKKVLISAPAGSDVKTVVFGVNDEVITTADDIVSNASCTTNCLAPLAKVLHEVVGIEQGLMVTVHAFTNDQSLTDSAHSDLRRARAATQSMIPTKTGAAAAVGMVLPELSGKLDGYAVRVPQINVSMVDLTFTAQQATDVATMHHALEQAAAGERPNMAALKGVLRYCDEPLVSIDFNHDAHSCIFDATQTRVLGNMVKVVAWYDNEWGFSNRMLDTARSILTVQ